MSALDYSDKRFLIVDGIKPSRDILKKMAFDLGCDNVDASPYVSDVIRWCSEVPYDVILLGYDLGENQKNGQQLLEELRMLNLIDRKSVVIIVTAETTQAMVLAALEHKPDDYLAKPYNLNELIKRLERCFHKKALMNDIYVALDHEQPKQIIELCDQAINKGTPYRIECYGIKSRQLFKLDQLDEALGIYHSFKDTKNCQWATIGLGRVAIKNKELAEAKKYFHSLKLKYPFYLPSYDWLATSFELEGDLHSAEKVLEQALKMSPYSVKRVKRYADICFANRSFDKATWAYQQNYKLSLSSIHHMADNAFLLAQSLDHLADDLSDYQIKLWKNKVTNALSETVKSFNTPDVRIRANLHNVNLMRKVNEIFDANRLLDSTENLLSKKYEELNASSALAIAELLIDLDRKPPANMLINQVIEAHADEIEIMTSVDKLLDDTKPNEDQLAAQRALDGALVDYQRKDYDASQDKLIKALAIFPNNLGIKLNLIQVLLVQFEHNRNKVKTLNYAGKLLNELSHLASSNRAYYRFNQLDKKFRQLKQLD